MALITGSAVLSDASRVTQSQLGITGFGYAVESTGTETLPGLVIADTVVLGRDGTFSQNAILGPGDLPLCLSDWTYVGGSLLDGTYVGGTWRTRWYDPKWLWYSIWYDQYNFDSSGNFIGTGPASLVGTKYRVPIRKDVGNYYASMVVPRQVGHYEARWVYEKDSSSYAHGIVAPFESTSLGIDAMPDYPTPQPPVETLQPNDDFEGNDSLGQFYMPPDDISDESPDVSEGGSYG
jgi:hypothetical protein